jgi:hypothetical protein
MTLGKYILVGHEPVLIDDLLEWARWFESDTQARRVSFTQISPQVHVSTIFLGLDHNFGMYGPPLLFETMVFGGALHEACERYATWQEAEVGHAFMVQQAEEMEKLEKML